MTTEVPIEMLRTRAADLNIRNRSRMSREKLEAAIAEAEAAASPTAHHFAHDEVIENLKGLDADEIRRFIAAEDANPAARVDLIAAANARLADLGEATVRSDAQVRADDAAAVAAAGGVEQIAPITVPAARAGEGEVPRAATRGIYLDLSGKRRVVGAGQPVPDGWRRIESASLEDRTEQVLGDAE